MLRELASDGLGRYKKNPAPSLLSIIVLTRGSLVHGYCNSLGLRFPSKSFYSLDCDNHEDISNNNVTSDEMEYKY